MDRLRNTVSWVQKDKTKNYLVLTIFLRQEAPEVEDDEEEISRYEDGWEDANENDFDSFDWDND